MCLSRDRNHRQARQRQEWRWCLARTGGWCGARQCKDCRRPSGWLAAIDASRPPMRHATAQGFFARKQDRGPRGTQELRWYRERGSIRMTFTVNAAHAAAQASALVFPVVFALASVRNILAVPRIGTCDRHVAPPDDGESHAMRVHLARHETRRWRDVPDSGASHPTRVSVRCSPCSEACETRRCCLSLERPSGLQKEACLADVDSLEPSDRRRIWSAQEKAALLAEIDAEGGKVRLVARRLTEIVEKRWIGVASVYRVLADDAAGAVVVQPSR